MDALTQLFDEAYLLEEDVMEVDKFNVAADHSNGTSTVRLANESVSSKVGSGSLPSVGSLADDPLVGSAVEVPPSVVSTNNSQSGSSRPAETPSSAITNRAAVPADPPLSNARANPRGTRTSGGNRPQNCRICNKPYHPLRRCNAFRRMSHERKLRMVLLHGICHQCLEYSHASRDCSATMKCNRCDGAHHFLLHSDSANATARRPRPQASVPQRSDQDNSLVLRSRVPILPTVVVTLQHGRNRVLVRGLLDRCAPDNIICRTLVRQLQLLESQGGPFHFCTVTVSALYERDLSFTFTARVDDLSATRMPRETLPRTLRDEYVGYPLADPDFYISRPIALVLGPELCNEVRRTSPPGRMGLPLAENTALGWTISGAYTR